MRGQKDLKSMKRGSIGLKIEEKIDTKCLKSVWWKNRPTLGPNISGTKCERDKLIFSAERGGQSDCSEV